MKGRRSYVAVDLSHHGRVSSWEQVTPMGRYHLYVRRQLNNGEVGAGLLSFSQENDREKTKMTLLSRWEANNFCFSPRSIQGLKDFQAWDRAKEKRQNPSLRRKLRQMDTVTF
jgi:hypothetical protein